MQRFFLTMRDQNSYVKPTYNDHLTHNTTVYKRKKITHDVFSVMLWCLFLLVVLLLNGCHISPQPEPPTSPESLLPQTTLPITYTTTVTNSIPLTTTLPLTNTPAVASVPPIATLLPTVTSLPTPTPIPQSVRIIDETSVQSGTLLLYAFVAENPNEYLIAQNTVFTIIAYDSANTIINQETITMPLLLPGHTLGVVDSIELPSANSVQHVEITASPDSLRPHKSHTTYPFFLTDNVRFTDDSYSVVAGLVRNTYPKKVTYVRVYVLAYNAAGAIVGGGKMELYQMKANGTETIRVPLVTSEKPLGGVVVYALLTDESTF